MKAQFAQFKLRNISDILHILEETIEEKNWDAFSNELKNLEKSLNDLFEHSFLFKRQINFWSNKEALFLQKKS